MPYNNCELAICKFRNGGGQDGKGAKCLAFPVSSVEKDDCILSKFKLCDGKARTHSSMYSKETICGAFKLNVGSSKSDSVVFPGKIPLCNTPSPPPLAFERALRGMMKHQIARMQVSSEDW